MHFCVCYFVHYVCRVVSYLSSSICCIIVFQVCMCTWGLGERLYFQTYVGCSTQALIHRVFANHSSWLMFLSGALMRLSHFVKLHAGGFYCHLKAICADFLIVHFSCLLCHQTLLYKNMAFVCVGLFCHS